MDSLFGNKDGKVVSRKKGQQTQALVKKLKKQDASLGAKKPVEPPDQQISYGGHGKERVEILGPRYKEKESRIVERKEFEPPGELEKWIEKTEKEEKELTQPIRDRFSQILLGPARVSKPMILLPLTQDGTQRGLGYKVTDSIRWLAVWCLRLIKMIPQRARFKQSK